MQLLTLVYECNQRNFVQENHDQNKDMKRKSEDAHCVEKRRREHEVIEGHASMDPLSLPDVVVDNILGWLDEGSLLNTRLVCQSWNTKITSKYDLWTRQTERKGKFHYFLKAEKSGALHQHLACHKVHRQLQTVGGALRVEEHSSPLDCFHGRHSLTPSQSHLFTEDWSETPLCDHFILQPRRLWLEDHRAIVLTAGLLLMLLDLRTQTEVWKHKDDSIIDACYSSACRCIFAISIHGNVLRFSLDGRLELRFTSHRRLQDAWSLSAHSSGRFLLVGVARKGIDDVYLVNVGNTSIFKIPLTYPYVPGFQEGIDDDNNDEEEGNLDDEAEKGNIDDEEQEGNIEAEGEEQNIIDDEEERNEIEGENGEGSEEDSKEEERVDGEDEEEEEDDNIRDWNESMGFLCDERLCATGGQQQLAVIVRRERSVVTAVVSTQGRVLHQAHTVFHNLITFSQDSNCQLQTHFIVEKYKANGKGLLEKFSPRCTSTGASLTVLWSRHLPAYFAGMGDAVHCGDRLLLVSQHEDLLVLDLHTGQPVCRVPAILRRQSKCCSQNNIYHYRIINSSKDSPEQVARRVQISRTLHQTCCKEPVMAVMDIYLTNTAWMDGLTPDTTSHHRPVLLFRDEFDTFRCLHWDPTLWDLQAEAGQQAGQQINQQDEPEQQTQQDEPEQQTQQDEPEQQTGLGEQKLETGQEQETVQEHHHQTEESGFQSEMYLPLNRVLRSSIDQND